MTEGHRAAGGFVPRTLTPGPGRPQPGVVWLDRVSLTSGVRAPSNRPEAAGIGAATAAPHHARRDTLVGTIEVPPGYLVVDVRVGYGTATGAFMSELRFVDLAGQRKSAVVVLVPKGGPQLDPSGDASLFVDAPTAPPGQRTFVSIAASVAHRSDNVAIRNLRVHLTRA